MTGDKPRWWDLRRAQNTKAAQYLCPLCNSYLPALSEHVLLRPEGDGSRRRHAHIECVLGARKAGRLRTRDEWKAMQPKPWSIWTRMRSRFSRGG